MFIDSSAPTRIDLAGGGLFRVTEPGGDTRPPGHAASSEADMDRIDEIKRLYYEATPATVERLMATAIALLKELPTEEERERAAVYMDGLCQMRSEWAIAKKSGGPAPVSAGTRRRPAKRG